MSVAKGSDELWLEVNCQSNLVISGSPRNMFWHSGMYNFGGRATGRGSGPERVRLLPNSEYQRLRHTSQSMEDKFLRRKGNIPDRRLRSLSFPFIRLPFGSELSVKGSGVA